MIDPAHEFFALAPSRLIAGAFLQSSAAGSPYETEVAASRTQRLTRLTASDGWLTLVGLHFLQPRDNPVGHAPDNKIVLASGPAHFGTARLAADGKVAFTPAADSGALVDGQSARAPVELRVGGSGKPTLVVSGTVSFFVIERGGKPALRVKDSAAERRTNFLGLDYFPVDPS